ncbi:MAG: secretin N-terminal domain-containing protein [Pseudomonadota bacterium]
MGQSTLLAMAILTSCVATPDFSPSSDQAELEEAFRAQSVSAANARQKRESTAIEELRLTSAPDQPGLLLTVSLKDASRARVIERVFAAADIEHQIDVGHLAGRITSRFRDKPLIDGLNTLLAETGFVARVEGGIIHIKALDLVAIQDETHGSSDGFVSQELPLTYLLAEDAAKLLSSLYQNDFDQFEKGFSVETIAELNAVFVSGPRDIVRSAQGVIARADRPAPHIVIEALVVDIDTSSVESIGISFADGADGNFSALSVVPGQTGGNIVGTFSELATNSAQVTATINFLVARNAAKILARPYIAARSTKTASIQIVNDQFARVNRSGDDSSIISTDSVTAGVTMQITPLVTADETIRLDIVLEESRFGATAGDIIISKQRNSASTSMDVKSGQTIVIGGLNSSYRITEHSGLPWLRKIPLLNALAGEQGAFETRRQLVVYLTPYIWQPGEALPMPLQHLPDPILPGLSSLETGGRLPD